MVKDLLGEEGYQIFWDQMKEDFNDSVDVVLEELSDTHIDYFCAVIGVSKYKAIELRRRIIALQDYIDELHEDHKELHSLVKALSINADDLPF